MSRREAERKLRQAGYWKVRNNKHNIWSNGTRTFQLHQGDRLSFGQARVIKSALRKDGHGT